MDAYSGAVLIGGRSQRFGTDKATYLYGGKPLAMHVRDSLRGAAERFFVGRCHRLRASGPASLEAALFSAEACYEDVIPGGGGLSGIHSALRHAKHDWVAVAACDLPLLTPDFWRALAALRGTEPAVVPTDSAGRLQPLASFYHRRLAGHIEARLLAGRVALYMLADEVGARVVPWSELTEHVPQDVFTNVNAPSDLP